MQALKNTSYTSPNFFYLSQIWASLELHTYFVLKLCRCFHELNYKDWHFSLTFASSLTLISLHFAKHCAWQIADREYHGIVVSLRLSNRNSLQIVSWSFQASGVNPSLVLAEEFLNLTDAANTSSNVCVWNTQATTMYKTHQARYIGPFPGPDIQHIFQHVNSARQNKPLSPGP